MESKLKVRERNVHTCVAYACLWEKWINHYLIRHMNALLPSYLKCHKISTIAAIMKSKRCVVFSGCHQWHSVSVSVNDLCACVHTAFGVSQV